MTDRPFSEIDPNEPGMSGIPFDKLLWPPDLENPSPELLLGAVMDDPAYLGAKLEILVAMMRDWHSRFNALVDVLQQKDREYTEKLEQHQVISERIIKALERQLCQHIYGPIFVEDNLRQYLRCAMCGDVQT